MELHCHHEEKITAEKKTTNKQQITCITWLVLISYQFYQQLQQTFQTVVIKANTFLTVVLSVTVRWKHWVMFTVIYVMGEGKQEVLLKWFIVLIAVLDGVAACANSGYIEITFYSDNCGGK